MIVPRAGQASAVYLLIKLFHGYRLIWYKE